MKRFVKALEKDGDCFKFIEKKFPAITYEKIKAGIFDGPQIRQLIKDDAFTNQINETENNAWNTFTALVKTIL